MNTNRLANEKSPYLLQHAHNPVDWYAWGPEAFEKARAENLFIPTFALSPAGPYVPGTAIKGALRSGAVFDRWSEATLRDAAARMGEDRAPRNPAARAEDAVLGGAGASRMKRVSVGDSLPIAYSNMKVYLLRVATLIARGPDRYELGWKSQGRTVDARRIGPQLVIRNQ